MQSPFQNAINMKSEYVFIHQQDSLENKEFISKLKKYPVHIYMICRSPFVRLNNEKTIITKDEIHLTFFTTEGGTKREIEVKTINNPNQPIGKIETDYPFNIVRAYKPDGSEHSVAKANLLLRILSQQNDQYFKELDYEVLYVGQAFGKNGERITTDRLKKHEKAQKIFFDTQQKFPDSEVWFLSFTFQPLLLTMFRPRNPISESAFDKVLEHQEKLETTPISFDQQITITEASLIKYFNTYEYNKHYLDFPSREHDALMDCYTLDFNSVAFEISTECINSRLWSKSIAPHPYHYKNFFLHSKKDRKDMFKWFEND